MSKFLTALQLVSEQLNKQPLEAKVHWLYFSLENWKSFREAGVDMAQWSDEELNNADKITGLIGKKLGVECFISKPIKSFFLKAHKK